jgi:hypothetical protein
MEISNSKKILLFGLIGPVAGKQMPHTVIQQIRETGAYLQVN